MLVLLALLEKRPHCRRQHRHTNPERQRRLEGHVATGCCPTICLRVGLKWTPRFPRPSCLCFDSDVDTENIGHFAASAPFLSDIQAWVHVRTATL